MDIKEKEGKRLNRIRLFAAAFLFVLTFKGFSASFALADTLGTADWSVQLAAAGKAIRDIGLVFSALGLAWCGIKYLKGGDQEASQAVHMALLITIAAAVLLLIPNIIQTGVRIGQAGRWKPHSPMS